MARTTDDKKGKTVILRINDELHEKLKAESGAANESISEYIRGILSSETKCNTELGDIEKLRAENCVLQNRIKELAGVPQVMSEETYKDLEQMCRLSGLTIDRFMEYIRRLFNDGRIYIEGLTVKTRGECDVRELEAICHRMNVDPQDMIDRLVKGMLRG